MMRRCDRHTAARNEPYFEFSFEKSLRKYEQSPQKKIKVDRYSLSKPRTAGQQDGMRRLRKVDVSQQKGTLRGLKCQGSRRQCQVRSNQLIMDGNRQDKVELDHAAKQNMADQYLDQPQKQEPIKAGQGPICTAQIQKQQQPQRQSNQENIAIMNTVQIRKVIQNVAAIQNEAVSHNLLTLGGQTGLAAQKEAAICKVMKEGRLQLTQNIWISLRPINRYRQNGVSNQEILQELLKRRNLEIEERGQVTTRLREILQSNQ